MSTDQLKKTFTSADPRPVIERTFTTPGMSFIASSIGRVTVAIIQSGAGGALPVPFLTSRLRRGQPVADLADEAFFDKRRMVVRTGNTYLAIDAPTDLSVMIMLGGQALARVMAAPPRS